MHHQRSVMMSASGGNWQAAKLKKMTGPTGDTKPPAWEYFGFLSETDEPFATG